MKNKKLAQPLLIILAVLIVAGAVIFYFTHDAAYVMSEDGFQVSAGEKVSYEKGTKFIFTKEGTSYKGAEANECLTSNPLYFKKNTKDILLPEDQIYVAGRKAIYKKAEAFSTFSVKDGLTYNDSVIEGGFIFNGTNTYTFLESMTLTVNGEEIELGPLSSITLGQDAYYLYNTATKEIKLDHLNVDKVEAKNADYSIDLVNDILYTSSGDKILLYTKTDQLEDLK